VADTIEQEPVIASPRRVEDVRAFWNTEACGTSFVPAQKGTAEFYEQYRALRYQVEWHIPLLVPFAATSGKKVLEIGCGNGADGVLFAEAGAEYTGVDLTEAAIQATRQHFKLLGLKGTFQTENAERLTFESDSFDLVYSHGVLHHTANPLNAFKEVHRVLKPGGKAVLMLYHKNSFNYYVRILTYMRLRALGTILSRIGRFAQDRALLTDELKGVRGNRDQSIWQIHYENFLKFGWSYLKAENFVHHATDGPECPYAFVYNSKTARVIFSGFRKVETVVAHFPLRRTKLEKLVPLNLEKRLASFMGWYLFVYLTK
jgi:ubiquinone/menaquinone biosynthesis C-methylase UbiE